MQRMNNRLDGSTDTFFTVMDCISAYGIPVVGAAALLYIIIPALVRIYL